MPTRVIVPRSELPADDSPPLCARCGMAPAAPVELRLPFTHSNPGQKVPKGFGGVLFLGQGMTGLGAALFIIAHSLLFTRRIRLWLPLCAGHERTAWWQRVGLPWISVFLYLSTFAAIFVAVLAMFRGDFKDDIEREIPTTFLAYCIPVILLGGGALLVRARIHDGFIYTLDIGEEWVELGGVCEAFATEVGSTNPKHTFTQSSVQGSHDELR
jgi:hypothetical protein